MEILATVISKQHSIKQDGDSMYSFYLKLQLDEKDLNFQGQPFVPAVEVSEKTFDSVNVGDTLKGELFNAG